MATLKSLVNPVINIGTGCLIYSKCCIQHDSIRIPLMLCPSKTRFVAVCFLATLFASFGAARADTIPEIVAKTKQAVVEILTYDEQNRLLKTGTGFFISPDGALLTNYHVISGGSSIVAKTPTGAVYFLRNIVTESEADDIAELQFLAEDVPYLTLGSSSRAVEVA
jgi:S1-C subfamily serine protease